MSRNNRPFQPGPTLARRRVLAGAAALPLLPPLAGCARVLASAAAARSFGLDGESLKEQVDRDQIRWAVSTDHFAISEPMVKTYPPVTLLVQGSLEPIELGDQMSTYTKLEDLGNFADAHGIDRVDNTPTVWLFQWVERAQGPMIFETGFVVPEGARCPENRNGYRIKRIGALKVSSIVYRGPYPFEPNSGWSQIRWAERAAEKGFQYTEKLYRELYYRHGGKRPRRPRVTAIEISIA
jgi:hypothetical protein